MNYSPDLDNPAGLLGGSHHLEAFANRVGHRFFTVNILACADGIDHDLLVRVVRDRSHDAVDLFVVQQFLVAPRGMDGFPHNFSGMLVAAVIEIRGRHAFDPRHLDGCRQKSRPFHADTDNSKPDPIAGLHRARCSAYRIRFKPDGTPCQRSGGGAGSVLQELSPRPLTIVHDDHSWGGL